jgi:hypothetical protein
MATVWGLLQRKQAGLLDRRDVSGVSDIDLLSLAAEARDFSTRDAVLATLPYNVPTLTLSRQLREIASALEAWASE